MRRNVCYNEGSVLAHTVATCMSRWDGHVTIKITLKANVRESK